VKAVAEKGFKLIHAASDFFYLVSNLFRRSNVRMLKIICLGLRRWRLGWGQPPWVSSLQYWIKTSGLPMVLQ
jgi:hypothetical protein